MRYFTYGNSGGIDNIKKELSNPKVTFDSIKEMLFEVSRRYQDAWGVLFDIEDLSIRYYGYDERIEKDVYMICTNRHGDKNFIEMYGCPQFVSYFVTV